VLLNSYLSTTIRLAAKSNSRGTVSMQRIFEIPTKRSGGRSPSFVLIDHVLRPRCYWITFSSQTRYLYRGLILERGITSFDAKNKNRHRCARSLQN
jgi:hypothetical protein